MKKFPEAKVKKLESVYQKPTPRSTGNAASLVIKKPKQKRIAMYGLI